MHGGSARGCPSQYASPTAAPRQVPPRRLTAAGVPRPLVTEEPWPPTGTTPTPSPCSGRGRRRQTDPLRAGVRPRYDATVNSTAARWSSQVITSVPPSSLTSANPPGELLDSDRARGERHRRQGDILRLLVSVGAPDALLGLGRRLRRMAGDDKRPVVLLQAGHPRTNHQCANISTGPPSGGRSAAPPSRRIWIQISHR